MRRLSVLVLIMTSHFATAQANDDLIATTMKCVRGIVEGRLGGPQGLTAALGFIDQLTKGEDPAAECQKAAGELTRFDITRRQQFAFVKSATGSSVKARKIVEQFIAPRASCEKVGISAVAGLFIVGVKVKLDGARCTATNGRKWIEVSPGAGWESSVPLIAYIGANAGTLEREITPNRSPVDVSATESFLSGGLIVMEGEGSFQPLDQPSLGVQGIGLGAGTARGITGQVNLTIIPLGTYDSVLLDQFLKH